MGKATSKLLAQKGANICIVARTAKKLEVALEEIKVLPDEAEQEHLS
jgi:short-subunit dehydrogenase